MQIRSLGVAALVVSLALVMGSAASAQEPAALRHDLVLRDVHVVDVVSGRVLENRTVTVDDGRITGVLDAAGSAAVSGERVVEGRGRFLAPGLWDAHVHFRGGEELLAENRALLPLYAALGVTTVRDAGGDLTPALLRWRDAIERGLLIGPRILTSGPKLDGPRPAWEGSIALASPAEVPAALDSLVGLGADYVKIYDGSVSAEVFLAIVREAEARGLTVTGHMPLSVNYLEAVEAGLDATEHLYYAFKAASGADAEVTEAVRAGEMGFWDGMYRTLDAPDPERARRVFQAMARHGSAVVPTLHIGDVLSQVERVDHSGDPELQVIGPGIEATYQRRVESAKRASPESRRQNRRLREAMAAMVAPMHEAGVTILAGSDAGPFNSFTYPGFALHEELQALVEAGLTEADALRAATTAPAAFMGLGDELGQVAEGYVADLVLMDRNPLEDIGNTLTISTVVLGGERVLDPRDLVALIASVQWAEGG